MHVHSPCPPFHCFHSPPGKSRAKLPQELGENVASKNHLEIKKIRNCASKITISDSLNHEMKTKTQNQELPSNNSFSCPQNLTLNLHFLPPVAFAVARLLDHIARCARPNRCCHPQHRSGARGRCRAQQEATFETTRRVSMRRTVEVVISGVCQKKNPCYGPSLPETNI